MLCFGRNPPTLDGRSGAVQDIEELAYGETTLISDQCVLTGKQFKQGDRKVLIVGLDAEWYLALAGEFEQVLGRKIEFTPRGRDTHEPAITKPLTRRQRATGAFAVLTMDSCDSRLAQKLREASDKLDVGRRTCVSGESPLTMGASQYKPSTPFVSL